MKSHMPSEIVDLIYKIGPMPIEDVQFLRVVELACKYVEKKKRNHQIGDSKSYKNNEKKSEKRVKTIGKIKIRQRRKKINLKIMRRSRKQTITRKEITNLKTPKKH
jgi:hypothetical protein